jgi:DNA-binding transcriptional regulator WhiA
VYRSLFLLDYNGHFVIDESCQINKQNAYLLLAFLQSGSVPELDMHESKHVLPGQFVHSEELTLMTMMSHERINRPVGATCPTSIACPSKAQSSQSIL